MSKTCWILAAFPLALYFRLEPNRHFKKGLIQAKSEGGILDNWCGGHRGVGPPDEDIIKSLTLSGLNHGLLLDTGRCLKVYMIKITFMTQATHSMARASLNKIKNLVINTTNSSPNSKRLRICINWNLPFQNQIYLSKSTSKCEHCEATFTL